MAGIILASETNVSRSAQLSNTILQNFFVERQNPEAKGQAPLFSAPGIDVGITIGGGPVRGSWNFNGVAYYVSGDELWRVDAAYGTILIGAGIAGTGTVGMSDNGTQLCIVNGQTGWIYNAVTGVYQQITAAAFYPAATVTFMDGYFIFDRLGTNEFFLSALYDGLTYNGLDFGTAEGQPGFVTATVQNLQLLFIFASAHIELWYDSGAANFPFERYAGGIINYGCVSPQTIVKQDGAVFFLGADHVFYRLQANVPIRISTHAIEHMIEEAPDITTAFCFTYTIEGHKMVALCVPSANFTVEFDISTGKWHTRNSVDSGFNDLGRWRANTAIAVYDNVYFGDAFSGQIGMLDWTTYTEFGNPIVGIVQTLNQHHDRKRTYCSRFELDMQVGVGLGNGQGSDPQVMLQRSKDGGMTWSKGQMWRSMGKEGEYTKRLRWLAQGQGRQLMWRLVITDPVPRTIIAAYADLTAGI